MVFTSGTVLIGTACLGHLVQFRIRLQRALRLFGGQPQYKLQVILVLWHEG